MKRVKQLVRSESVWSAWYNNEYVWIRENDEGPRISTVLTTSNSYRRKKLVRPVRRVRVRHQDSNYQKGTVRSNQGTTKANH